ncbi:hypothetical protein NIES4106_62220 (plasmid) [Fischerella sp. NIES-4106]|nr:hypothetical protein NIES4106_62220 [Fischerella sp. NIES-4106]
MPKLPKITSLICLTLTLGLTVYNPQFLPLAVAVAPVALTQLNESSKPKEEDKEDKA